MAKKTIVSVESDLSGKSPAETVLFSWDSYQYEIDLTEQEKEELGSRFKDIIEAARVKGKRVNGKPRPARSTVEASPATVREWARSQGFDVPKRGRIPADVIEKFNAAEKGSAGESIPVPLIPDTTSEVDEKPARVSRKKTAQEEDEGKAVKKTSKPVASEARFSG